MAISGGKWKTLLVVVTMLSAVLAHAENTRVTGESIDGFIQLPNQWRLSPAGEGRPLGTFPMNSRLSPDGQYLAVLHCGAGEHEIIVIRVSDGQTVSRAPLANSYYGLAFSRDGDRLYASGGDDEVVHVFRFDKGYLSEPREIRIAEKDAKEVPCGIALSPDDTMLAVAATWGNKVYLLHADTGAIAATFETGEETRPYDCVFSPDGARLFVSYWGGAGVAVFEREKAVQFVPTGDHPNEMLMSRDGSRFFVANANVNTVSVIDTATLKVSETLNTALYPDALEGSTPNALAVDADEKRLYVANADNNEIVVYDIEKPGATRALGFIPVGWYPTSVRVAGDKILVANGKGFSSFANPRGPNPYMRGKRRTSFEQHAMLMTPGTLSIIPVPDQAQLDIYSKTAYACSPYRKDVAPVASPPDGSPIPGRVGDPSPIRYCIYIIKENRTYDQVLGDMPEGNGDPTLCLFPEKFSPNHHALAREFVLLDNFYVESQVSADGHEWTVGAYATDFVQKTWPSSYGGHGLRYPAEGSWPTAFPTAGYIWDRCAEAGISYRSYGEFIENAEKVGDPGYTNVESLEGHFDPMFRTFDMDYLDADRADRFLEEFNQFIAQGIMPQFTVLRLPNDHTAGSEEGKLTPRAYVADNDLALGRVIEAISESPIWKETAIFIVEDDAQNGPDHIDAHRTIAFVVSPYTRGRGRDNTFYSTASMLRTMELILGLQPMSQFDAGALPMYNTFKNEPDLAPYVCRDVPESLRTPRNEAGAWGQDLMATMNIEKEDAADDLLFNEVIWRTVKGADSPMPAPVRAAFVRPWDEDEG